MNIELAEKIAQDIKSFVLSGIKLTDSVTEEDIKMVTYKRLQTEQPDPLPKFWILEVGDEPDDEKVQGPYDTMIDAMRMLMSHTYYLWRLPNRGKNFLYWTGQISGLYLVHSLEKPSYDKDLRFQHSVDERE